MKRRTGLLAALTLFSVTLFSVLAFSQTVTVTGLVSTMGPLGPLAGSNNDFVIFRLKNWQGNLPRCASNGVINPLVYQVIPNGSGVFSTTFCGNDQVTPTNTYYAFEQWHDGKMQSTANYQFCVGTSCVQGVGAQCPCSVNTQAPLTSTPTAALFGGFGLLAGNNVWTGTNTFLSTVTVPTVALSDNALNAVNSAWVKGQGYSTIGAPSGSINADAASHAVSAATLAVQIFETLGNIPAGNINTTKGTVHLRVAVTINSIVDVSTGYLPGICFTLSAVNHCALVSGPPTPISGSRYVEDAYCTTQTTGVSGVIFCDLTVLYVNNGTVGVLTNALVLSAGVIDLTQGIAVGAAIQFSGTASSSNVATQLRGDLEQID